MFVAERLSDSGLDLLSDPKVLFLHWVQHRILAVKSSRDKSLVVHFIYVFHPESADAFSDNIFKISQFSCTNRDMWVTNITLKSWSFARTQWSFPERPCQAKQAFYGPTLVKTDVSADELIELPLYLHKALGEFQQAIHDREDKFPGQIRFSSSSIVLSTNNFGDFSKCSIISELISEATLKQLEKELPILWQRFIHQPQTGRYLVFLLILGYLCHAIALELQEAVDFLTTIINIEGGQDWVS
ncbi:hypothetical protein DL98DRAFT_618564 [Cadophora sp. DSE1049]|nr:hypothetical protein DL98DRAFT_618564 [Cadophora sp. DSE1049]